MSRSIWFLFYLYAFYSCILLMVNPIRISFISPLSNPGLLPRGGGGAGGGPLRQFAPSETLPFLEIWSENNSITIDFAPSPEKFLEESQNLLQSKKI